MSGKWLLDTNLVIALFAQDPSVLERLSGAAEVFVPSIVLGELYYGAQKSGRVEANLARIDELVANTAVLGCDAVTAQQLGWLAARRLHAGKTHGRIFHYRNHIGEQWLGCGNLGIWSV